MSDSATDRSSAAPRHPLKRRGLLVGAGAAGAVVLAAKTLTGVTPIEQVAATATEKVVDPSGGYQVTDHVLRYYETTRA